MDEAEKQARDLVVNFRRALRAGLGSLAGVRLSGFFEVPVALVRSSLLWGLGVCWVSGLGGREGGGIFAVGFERLGFCLLLFEFSDGFRGPGGLLLVGLPVVGRFWGGNVGDRAAFKNFFKAKSPKP